jgi:hypothetical protein
MIFERLSPHLPQEIDGARPHSCSSNIRLYKYEQGDSFGKHYDDTNPEYGPAAETGEQKVAIARSKGKGNGKGKGGRAAAAELIGWSKLTILIYLNNKEHYPVQGGDTIFYTGDTGDTNIPFVSFSPADEQQAGAVLMHGHGHRCLLHEGMPVLSGVKYLLRTDVIYA